MTEQSERPDLMGWFFAIAFSLGAGLALTLLVVGVFTNTSSTQDGSETWGIDDVLLMMVTFAPLVATVLARKRVGWLRRSLYKPVE